MNSSESAAQLFSQEVAMVVYRKVEMCGETQVSLEQESPFLTVQGQTQRSPFLQVEDMTVG